MTTKKAFVEGIKDTNTIAEDTTAVTMPII